MDRKSREIERRKKKQQENDKTAVGYISLVTKIDQKREKTPGSKRIDDELFINRSFNEDEEIFS